MNKIYRVKNKYEEEIDTLVEGEENSPVTIVFVHGFGTDKNENGLFIDLANSLKDKFRLVRFDFTGCGKSEGKEEDACYSKETGDLAAILDWTKENYPGDIFLIAHSNGTFVTAALSPCGVSKTVFTGIVNIPASRSIDRLKTRILAKGGVFNEIGISIYPRTSGVVKKVGPSWWKEMENYSYLHEVAVTAIISKNGKYLITRRSKTKKRFSGMWTVPGGRLEPKDYISFPRDKNKKYRIPNQSGDRT